MKRGTYLKIEEVRKLLHAEPFRPFLIHVADGGRIPVKHEDFVALAPTGREMIVYQPDGMWQVIDVMLVTRLQVIAKNGSKKPSK
ncbi:MAG TPA: hypothetical protein VK615_15755 [Candidatus Binatia bacterium]|nr:hypothetical protein [Candidatus Binatia bacterium]